VEGMAVKVEAGSRSAGPLPDLRICVDGVVQGWMAVNVERGRAALDPFLTWEFVYPSLRETSADWD
ncbi:MAG: hypothetical protein ABR555_13315, partial [Pyrinomonadaceae bacterium]